MQFSVAAAFASCLAVSSAFQPDLTPPKQPGTPFFNLQIGFSPNASLIGQYMWNAFDLFGDVMMITPNHTQAGVFYQSTNWTTPQHPLGGPVLVRNISNAVPYDVPGPPYTIRNQIVGGAFENPQDDRADLPMEAAIGEFTEEIWAQVEENVEMDFHIDPLGHLVHMNQAPGLKTWNKVSICWHFDGAESLSRIIVAEKFYEGAGFGCSPVQFIWTFVDF